ncbi:hypothetical protein D3C84_682960 [compost metagenome]
MEDHPATSDPPVALVKHHRHVVGGQQHSWDPSAENRLTFRVDRYFIATSDRLEHVAIANVQRLVRQQDQAFVPDILQTKVALEQFHRATAHVFLANQQLAQTCHDRFATAAFPRHLQEQLPVVAIRQHHEQRRVNAIHLGRIIVGCVAQPLHEVGGTMRQGFPHQRLAVLDPVVSQQTIDEGMRAKRAEH